MWRKVALERYHGEPPMRSQSATCLMGSKMYIFGGLGAGASNNLCGGAASGARGRGVFHSHASRS